MTAKSTKKRPKVRYVARFRSSRDAFYAILSIDEITGLEKWPELCRCDEAWQAKRIAAALNVYEARRRREL